MPRRKKRKPRPPSLPATVPMTPVETEALAFACTWFHHWREYRDAGGHPLARHSPLTVDAGRAVARFAFSLGATASTVQARLHVVAAARMGEPEAMAAIEQIILELQSRGAQMPVEFAAYDMDRKAGLLRPHRSSGPKLRDRLMRNTFIALAVEALCDRFDLMPTRKHRGGQPSARRSASSIAAEAYSREAGQGGIGEKRVEEIWSEQRGVMPTVAGWSAHF